MADDAATRFAQEYADRSGVTLEKLREWSRVVCPCQCGADKCEGWAMVSRESVEFNREHGARWLGGTDYGTVAWE